MKQYKDLLQKVLSNGQVTSTRSGNTKRILFERIEFDLSSGKFPLLGLRKISFHNIMHELIWFIRGEANITYLLKNNVKIWTSDCLRYQIETKPYMNTGEYFNRFGMKKVLQVRKDYEKGNPYPAKRMLEDFEQEILDVNPSLGDLGFSYPIWWRKWIDSLKMEDFNPGNRRLVMNAWNEQSTTLSALPPCHYGFQILINNDRSFDLQWNQRSVDIMLGLPYNIASYALLMEMIGRVYSLKPRRLIGSLGDVHLYMDHLDAAKEILDRENNTLPSVDMPVLNKLTDYDENDFELYGYQPLEALENPIFMLGGIV